MKRTKRGNMVDKDDEPVEVWNYLLKREHVLALIFKNKGDEISIEG